MPERPLIVLCSLDAQAFALAQLAVWRGGALTRDQAVDEAPGTNPTKLDLRRSNTLKARLARRSGRRLADASPRGAMNSIDLPGRPVNWSLRHITTDRLAGTTAGTRTTRAVP